MRKILEIGGGRNPYFIRYRIPWNSTHEYMAVDINEKNINMSKKAIEKHAGTGKTVPTNPTFLISDASSLQLEPETVDTVVISNTLSAPIHHDWDRNGNKLKVKNEVGFIERDIKSESDTEDPFYIERKKLIDEALRVLKVGGSLSVYTDLLIYGHHSYKRILEELKNNPSLVYLFDGEEARRIDKVNTDKLSTDEFCCCFRAEVLPESEVHVFTKIE